jgi:hypothetical protein
MSVYTICSLAAREDRVVANMDALGALLNSDLVEEVLMKLEPQLAKIPCDLAPEQYKEFKCYDGASSCTE